MTGRPGPKTAASEDHRRSLTARQPARALPSPSYTHPGAKSATDTPEQAQRTRSVRTFRGISSTAGMLPCQLVIFNELKIHMYEVVDRHCSVAVHAKTYNPTTSGNMLILTRCLKGAPPPSLAVAAATSELSWPPA